MLQINKFKQESGRHSAIGLNITKMWEDFCSNHKKLPNPESSTTTYEPVVKLWVYYRFFNELVKSKYAGMPSYKERDSNTQETKGKDNTVKGNLQYIVDKVPELQTQTNNHLLHNEFDIPPPAASYTVLDCSQVGAGTELVLVSGAVADPLINSSGLESYNSLQLSHATSDSDCQSRLLNNIDIASKDSNFGCYIARYDESSELK